MAALKGMVLSLAHLHESPSSLVAEANRQLSRNLDAHSFATLSYAVLDLVEQRGRFVRAGHCPLLRWQAATGEVSRLSPQGVALGLVRDESFGRGLEEASVELGSGDVLLFFTDGLSEAIKQRILDELRAFVGDAPQQDDMTFVVARLEPDLPTSDQ